MSDESELPNGWVRKPLGRAAQLVKDKVNPGTVPDAHYIGLEHVEAQTMRLLGSGRGSDVKSAKTKFSAGDVLYGKLRPYLNKVAQPPFEGISSTDFLVLRESDDLDAAYLAQFLNQLSVSNYAHHVSTGVSLPRVDWKSLSTLEIAFPSSKTEQRAIVALIERARGLSSSASKHIGEARQAINRFRHAVLTAACSGRLTADWRADNPNESAEAALLLHEAANQDVRINKRRLKPAYGLRLVGSEFRFPETWSFKPVRELIGNRAILDVQDGNHGELYPRREDFTTDVEDGVPYISAESISDVVLLDEAPRLKREVAARLRIGFAVPRDVILTHNATVGRVAVVPQDSPDVVLSTSTTYYRTDARVLLPEYLACYMRSHYFQRQLAAVMAQTTRNQVPVTKQVELSVAVPPVSEQAEVVLRAGLLLDKAKRLDKRIELADRSVDRSAQAVLAKAFQGNFA